METSLDYYVGTARRLTAREKKHPETILHYPKDHVFKPLYSRRYGKLRATKPNKVDQTNHEQEGR